MKKFIAAYDQAKRQWHHLSPSLLQAYEDCHRIPYFDKIKRLPKPEFKATILGTKMHAQLEHLVLTGQDCLEPRLKPLRQYLPAQLPDPKVLPELGTDCKTKFIRGDKPFDYEHSVLRLEGLPVEGYLDLFDKRSPDYPIVTDYKTTKEIAKWGASPEQVAKSLPLLLYAKAATIWVPEAPEVRVRHLYAQTEMEVRGEPRATVLTRAQIDAGWERANVLAQGLKSLEGKVSDEGIEPTGIAHGMCTKYHGCPFMQTCLKTPQAMLKQRLKLAVERNETKERASTQTREETQMNLIERIRQKQAEAATPPAPVEQAVQKPPATPERVAPLIIDESTTPDVPRGFVGIIPPDAPPNNKDAVVEPKKRGRPKKDTSAKIDTSAKSEVLDISEVKTLEIRAENDALIAKMQTPEAKAAAQALFTATPELLGEAAVKAAMESKTVSDVGQKASVVQDEQHYGHEAKARLHENGKLPIRLYINALPPHWELFRDLSEYAAEKAQEIAKALQVQDYRLTDLGAVKGVGGLASLIREEPPAAGTYVAFTTGFGTPVQVAVDTLLPLVAWYTRGVR